MKKKTPARPGNSDERRAASRPLATPEAASEGHDQDEKIRAAITCLQAERDQDSEAGREQARSDGEEWAHSASLADLRRVFEAEEVIAKFTEAIRPDLQSAHAYYKRGEAHCQNQEYDKAIADYTETIRIISQFAEVYLYRGLVHYEIGEYEKAIDDLTEAIRLEPKRNALPRYRRAEAYAQKGEHEKAIADLSELIRLNPEDMPAYVNRGLAHYEIGEYEKAIDDLTEAILLGPSNEVPFYYRGMAYEKIGKLSKAIADFTEAIMFNELDYAAIAQYEAWRGLRTTGQARQGHRGLHGGDPGRPGACRRVSQPGSCLRGQGRARQGHRRPHACDLAQSQWCFDVPCSGRRL